MYMEQGEVIIFAEASGVIIQMTRNYLNSMV